MDMIILGGENYSVMKRVSNSLGSIKIIQKSVSPLKIY